jgi:hypothetical protein
LNYGPPDISLPGGQDYRCEPLLLTLHHYLSRTS